MKRMLTLFSAAAVVLTFGLAFADDIPTWATNNIASEEFARAFPKPVTDLSILCAKDFGAAVLPDVTAYDETITLDTGRTLYKESIAMRKSVMEESGARGMAAGGVCPEAKAGYPSERERIWNELPIFHGGGDVPFL